MAATFFFRFAEEAGAVDGSRAASVAVPRRHPSLRRPLSPQELAEIWTVATTTGMDPELDERILTFLRHTACRRGGLLGLTVDALDPRRQIVRVTERYGDTRILRLHCLVVTDLLTFAASRGSARPTDPVFRYRNGDPLTRRRFSSLFDRVDRHTTFSEPLDVSARWIRHTTLADIAAVSDLRVAAAFAGHSPHELGVIGGYTTVSFDDLRQAYEAVFGVA
jgi:site-specific recombinase XerD